MLFTDWEVRIGRNCARGLEYRTRQQQPFLISRKLARQNSMRNGRI